MDAKTLLDQLIEAGKKLAEDGLQRGGELAAQGKEMAAQGIEYAKDQLPPPGPERDALMTKLGVGAAAAGLLGLLATTKSGRNVLAPVVKIGSAAALGGLAYKLYSDWQAESGNQVADDGIEVAGMNQLTDQSANDRSLLLVRAMIFAAKADGSIDDAESKQITDSLDQSELEDSTTQILMREIQQPVDVEMLAKEAGSPQVAAEIYLASLMVTGVANEAERKYLDQLAEALQLDAAFVRQLEATAVGA